jgi:uncharacterized protein (DUF1697 family)
MRLPQGVTGKAGCVTLAEREGDPMTVYVALLRGINVSGQKIIKMEALRAIFASLQFQNVKTYIQSGNVIFESTEDSVDVLQERTESRLEETLGYKVPVMIRTMSELEKVIRQNPFARSENIDDGHLYVTFLSQVPTADAIHGLESYKNDVDDFRVVDREVYLLCRNAYGRSLFSNNFLENKLGVLATTRNWNTVNRIANMIKREYAAQSGDAL